MKKLLLLFILSTTAAFGQLEIGNPNNLYSCDYDNDGIAQFELTANDVVLLNGLNPANYDVAYHWSAQDAENGINPIQNPTAFLNVNPHSQTVYARITEIANQLTYATAQFTISVLLQPQPGTVEPIIILDFNDDGMSIVDLTQTESQILNGQPQQMFTMTYHLTEEDAQNELNEIQGEQAFYVTTQTIYFRVSNSGYCNAIGSFDVIILSPGYETAQPTGESTQTFNEGETLADLDVEGENIQWYLTPGDAPPSNMDADMPLPMNTVLMDNTTYYASQTLNGIESVERYPVTAVMVLGMKNQALAELRYYPNPVKEVLTISNTAAIDGVVIYSTLGQVVLEQKPDTQDALINMASLESGIYIVKISSNNQQKTIRIIKQ
ncbi:MAG: T9SS type A sorting domain-containing protein [Sphingobacteriaceae bacterium]|nr:MAG: T9SS type A sorting domain-containing protein [Sphingobacteriaceae bacterium]